MGRLWYALLVFASLHGGVIEMGYAPHYAPGVMDQVARTRNLAPGVCQVSRPEGPIGGWTWVYGERTGALLHCQIVDISHPRDRARHIRTGRVVEISFENARQLCGSTSERVIDCPVTIVWLQ